MSGTDVQGTLRDMWETRPARPRQGRQIAGVAAAVARRYDLDPVLVRVGLVVAAFYGIGAALYIAGWVLLPDEQADGAPRANPRPLLLVGLVVAATIGIGAAFGDQGGLLLPAVAVAVLLVLLHRSRGGRSGGVAVGTGGTRYPDPAQHGAAGVGGTDAAAPGAGGADTSAAGAHGTGTPAVAGAATATTPVPPAWDPLGAAPFAWDLPEPQGPPPAPRRRRPTTPVTLALALLAGGITVAVMLLAGGGVEPATVLGAVLAVLGAGLLVGAATRSGRGLVPVALLASALTYGVLAAPPVRWDAGVGDVRLTPATASAVAPVYEQGAGSFVLDLRAVDLAVPEGTAAEPVRTRIAVGFGEVQVLVPADADVSLTGSAGLGTVVFGERESNGAGAALSVADDLGADGMRSGRPIVLDVEAGAGSVEVRRG